jgi:hypothetical protein
MRGALSAPIVGEVFASGTSEIDLYCRRAAGIRPRAHLIRAGCGYFLVLSFFFLFSPFFYERNV